ncbi:hypothetical protein ALP26_101617 [Pseudomonas savastanoi pv. glycinea]|nr:hypothetical protein ALO37_101216 [Pseudomonas savastanoi pv. glycinea]RMM86687.1 hypothetical protein ALQ68_101615 [Pseudomonas savastanoi pv. glycinea]RMM86835.1 hypothetical protein ALQ70_101291 [Pseudomonas savastanoi pv. glycinea]RMN04392.1 hypothetical protein ALQ69_101762 [Pseudomonas savastanoi pv. glycinea]RMP97191.1 hypothetical protein ALQ12_101239 [Pseudomonas savastanoi pv. glycinea]
MITGRAWLPPASGSVGSDTAVFVLEVESADSAQTLCAHKSTALKTDSMVLVIDCISINGLQEKNRRLSQ